jgi:hypothetical protein
MWDPLAAHLRHAVLKTLGFVLFSKCALDVSIGLGPLLKPLLGRSWALLGLYRALLDPHVGLLLDAMGPRWGCSYARPWRS